MKNLSNFNFRNKKVLVRCDFNIPLNEKNEVLNDLKVKRVWETVKPLILQRAKITLMGHLGQANGKKDLNFSLKKIAKLLEKYLDFPVAIADDCVGQEIEDYVNNMKADHILLLENLQFYQEEIDGDLDFAQKLCWEYEVFINDDFADCNKNYASIVSVPQFLDSKAGNLLENEVINLNKFLQNKSNQSVVIIGGMPSNAKVEFIDNMTKFADFVLVNGLIKQALTEKGLLFKNQEKIICPVGFNNDAEIDEQTIKLFKEKILSAKNIFAYDFPGKEIVANAIINSKAFSIVAGDSAINFLAKQGTMERFSFVSFGNEATLSYLNGENLAGLSALD